MTFLELVQAAVRESGTANIGEPSSVSTTGRLLRFVNWTREAYRQIQQDRDDWRWLDAEFTGTLTAGTRDYSASSFSLSRFSHWLNRSQTDEEMWTIYKTSEGIATEQRLAWERWDDYRRRKLIGASQLETDKPHVVAMKPDDSLSFFPIPDDGYTVRGRYYRSPQVLTSDSDVPEMPSRFHDIIWYRALLLMSEHDEAMEQYPVWAAHYSRLNNGLMRTQAQRINLQGALA